MLLVYQILYADDGAFLFSSRENLITNSTINFKALRDFWLTMHIGSQGIRGKTEAMHFEPPRALPRDDASPTIDFNILDGFIHFCSSFRYLGATIVSNLTDASDILARIASATGAFAALKDTIFCNPALSYAAKRASYHAYVLSVLLYGCETWILTPSLYIRLRSFHRRCLRQIFGCTIYNRRVTYARSRTRTRHRTLCITFKMPELTDIILRRRLAWLGRIARLPDADLQRKLIDARTPYPPLPGRKWTLLPQSYVNDLNAAGINKDSWLQLAQDKTTWNSTIRHIARLKPSKGTEPSTTH
jgi:hypothetical protein